MKFKQFIKKQFKDPNFSTLKLIKRNLFFSFLCFIFVFLFFLQLSIFFNEIVQIQHIQKEIISNQFFLTSELRQQALHSVIQIPNLTYLLYGLSFFFLLYWSDYIVFLFFRYLELKRRLKNMDSEEEQIKQSKEISRIRLDYEY